MNGTFRGALEVHCLVRGESVKTRVEILQKQVQPRCIIC